MGLEDDQTARIMDRPIPGGARPEPNRQAAPAGRPYVGNLGDGSQAAPRPNLPGPQWAGPQSSGPQRVPAGAGPEPAGGPQHRPVPAEVTPRAEDLDDPHMTYRATAVPPRERPAGNDRSAEGNGQVDGGQAARPADAGWTLALLVVGCVIVALMIGLVLYMSPGLFSG
ncbi:hypothetical protein [Pseudonocardia phyllosphaerae]|uniref:hypothetical protein n=1 Tax=Pseudonocardia phyllosphaerae TaxID=3390502 RepID=UPI00397C9099